jgi:deoxyribodipyrimidine photo-lyase
MNDLFPEAGFEPTLEAAMARLAAVRPGEYARSRNQIDGAVTRLSPYITHGFLSLPQVLVGLRQKYRLDAEHKLVYELGWREFFHHVWQTRGEGIFENLHEGVLPDTAYARELPADIRQGATGVPVIDRAVRELYATGYLHNHARMWLASYVVGHANRLQPA